MHIVVSNGWMQREKPDRLIIVHAQDVAFLSFTPSVTMNRIACSEEPDVPVPGVVIMPTQLVNRDCVRPKFCACRCGWFVSPG